jgi:hypothetical protein
MKKLLLAFITIAAAMAHGQTLTTNAIPPRLTLAVAEGGVFVHYTAEIGRMYRLEESATLTNWTLLEQKVADSTNLSFYFETTNMQGSSLSGGGGGGGGSIELPSSFSATSQATSTTAKASKKPRPTVADAPLPYPWEPAYQARQDDTGLMSGNSSMSLQASEPPSFAGGIGTAAHKFYRVVVNDPRIQFPDWFPYVDQFMNFKVWTSITNGTYNLKLYQDGVLVFNNTAPVPANGRFGVSDLNYHANEWPFTGYYNVGKWELRVTVTPPLGLGEGEPPASATVVKFQRRPNWAGRRGLVLNMAGPQIFGSMDWAAVEDDFINEMLFTFAMSFAGAPQVTLDYTWRDEFDTQLQELTVAADWGKLRSLIYAVAPGSQPISAQLTDLHYRAWQ